MMDIFYAVALALRECIIYWKDVGCTWNKERLSGNDQLHCRTVIKVREKIRGRRVLWR